MNIERTENRTKLSLGVALFLASSIAVAGGGSHGWGPFDRSIIVDCSHPRASIQRALSRPWFQRPRVIRVIGTCHEDVLIEQDDVVVSGDWSGDGVAGGTVVGEITARGAQRIAIEYLRVTGPGNGVVSTEGSAVTIAQSELVDNEGSGALASRNALVKVSDSIIAGNAEGGLVASQNATVNSNGNRVVGNQLSAISIGNFSYFRGGSSASDPSAPDVYVQTGCAQGDAASSACGEADTFAVDCFRNGVCDIRNADITGAFSVPQLSILELRSSTVNGNISLNRGSISSTRSITGSGFVSCSGGALATGSVECGAEIPSP